MAPQLPPDAYQQSAQEAFARLTPQQRLQLGQHLRQRVQQQNYDVPDLNRDGIDDRLQDPRYLAQVAGRLDQQQPGLLGQLLDGGGEALANPLVKAALAGIAATAVKRMMAGG